MAREGDPIGGERARHLEAVAPLEPAEESPVDVDEAPPGVICGWPPLRVVMSPLRVVREEEEPE